MKYIKKMKSLLSFLIVTIILISSMSYTHAQNNDKGIIEMLRNFYVAYNRVWSSDYDNLILVNKLDSLQQKYCTKGLQQKLKKLYKTDGLDHDVMINDIYTDIESIKSILIIKDLTKDNSYIISYPASIEDASNNKISATVTIHVIVKKINDLYKIESVW